MEYYKAIGLRKFRQTVQFSLLTKTEIEEIETVSEVYPFRTNGYILNELIDWTEYSSDPIFRLNFPSRQMLSEEHYQSIIHGKKTLNHDDFGKLLRELRMKLNPHPGNQMDLNVPFFEGDELQGMQHKYVNTVLFFPNQGQTCHAFCTFCFRWPQFVGEKDLHIHTNEIKLLVRYLEANPQVSEVLITGGDPMVMSAEVLATYIRPLLEIPTLKNIRIGSKSLSFWPYKYLDKNSQDILNLFKDIVSAKKHLSFMAHFNHPTELSTAVVRSAIGAIRNAGAEIRTQSPLLKNINDNANVWSKLLEDQVQLGCVPYYMFLSRDTGAQHYFAVSLSRAVQIYKDVVRETNGLCKTIRGPVMSVRNGKVEILDYLEEDNVYLLRFIQHRNPLLSYKCFWGRPISGDPVWFDQLYPLHTSDEIYFS